jgi:CRISPR-associated exonuclease Cas4
MSAYTVTDIKEMGYCPRIVYYRYCLPLIHPPPTIKMTLGAEVNDRTEELEQRRSLRAYGLQTGERLFDVWLESEALGLCGRLDMLIITPDERIPVDYKNTDLPDPAPSGAEPLYVDWQWQLAAYALLVAEQPGAEVRRGFIYSVPARRATQVDFTPLLAAQVKVQIARITYIVEREAMPDPTPHSARCAACEYRRFCNDV